MENIWIEILFDGQPMENIIANTKEQAEELIKNVEKGGFAEMNEEIQEDWLSMGLGNNPKVTARICED